MPRETPPSNLESAVLRNNREIQGLAVRVETLDQHLASLTQSIDTLTSQIGRLTEATYETHSLLRESANRRDGQIDRLMEAADRRDTQIERLLSILERLIPPAPTVN